VSAAQDRLDAARERYREAFAKFVAAPIRSDGASYTNAHCAEYVHAFEDLQRPKVAAR